MPSDTKSARSRAEPRSTAQVVAEMKRAGKLPRERGQVEIALEPGDREPESAERIPRPGHFPRDELMSIFSTLHDLPSPLIFHRAWARSRWSVSSASTGPRATKLFMTASPESEIWPIRRSPSIIPLSSPRDSISGLASVHGQCNASSESVRSCSPLDCRSRPGCTSLSSRAGRARRGDRSRQVDIPDDRFIKHAEIDRQIAVFGEDRLGKGGVAETEAAVGHANDQSLGRILTDHRLERLVEVDRAVGKPLEIEVAAFDQECRFRGLGEEDLREAPGENGPRRTKKLVPLRIVKHDALDRG